MKARFLVLWNTPTDVEAFEKHYQEIHIPLAHQLKRLKSYTIGRNARPIRGEKPYYVIGELEWDSIDDMLQDFASPEGQATARDVEILSQWSPGVQSMTYELIET